MAAAALSSTQFVRITNWAPEAAIPRNTGCSAEFPPALSWGGCERLADGSNRMLRKDLPTRQQWAIKQKGRQPVWRCSTVTISQQQAQETAPAVPRTAPRTNIRLALPSKGRMAEETLQLLDDCQLTVRKVNPRQYVADIDQLEHVEVWFQRASDVVRKIKSGDVDIGIVGYDMVSEYGEGDDDLVVIHDALGFGGCHLAVAVPTYGEFGGVHSLEELAAMPQWTEENPLRVVTGYNYLGQKFLSEKGFKHFAILTADGALEAAPAMGTADVILDLVSSGTTLRENNLRELVGGKVLASEVVANIRAESEEDVASKIHQHTDFPGLQGPTISPVYTYDSASGKAVHNFYAITIIVPKPRLYDAVQQLRAIGGSGVLVSPLVYIFDEEPPRWRRLLKELGLESKF